MTETIHDMKQLNEWTGDATTLWLVTAIVQPFKLDAVTLALEGIADFRGVTVSDCRGFGRAKLAPDKEHGDANKRFGEHTPELSDYGKRVRLECATGSKESAVEVARIIARAAHTGRQGDGKVWIASLSGAVAVRTFDVDQNALI